VSPIPVSHRVPPGRLAKIRLSAALLAAWLAVILGSWQALQLPEQRAPRWAPTFAPLASAPLPSGEPVALAVPPAVAPKDRSPLLFEAAWQRPDLRWILLDGVTAGAAPRHLVALPGAIVPEGWRETWRRGGLRVFVRRPA
jgi:hypothetical protein